MCLFQRGRQIPVVLFRTRRYGWSVRAGAPIRKNTFVMEYVGEVFALACAPTDITYQFAMDTCGRSITQFCIDAFQCGNEARWVNHSCDPNMKTVGVLASRLDYRFQELAFFAVRDIAEGGLWVEVQISLSWGFCRELQP